MLYQKFQAKKEQEPFFNLHFFNQRYLNFFVVFPQRK